MRRCVNSDDFATSGRLLGRPRASSGVLVVGKLAAAIYNACSRLVRKVYTTDVMTWTKGIDTIEECAGEMWTTIRATGHKAGERMSSEWREGGSEGSEA